MNIEWRGNDHTNSSSRDGYTPIAIVNHVVAGSGQSCDNWFRSPNNVVSSAHFNVWEDGRITQYVDIGRMAWGNGLAIANIPRATAELVLARPNINPNKYTISIEHAGHTGKLTPEQFAATVWLHKWIKAEVKRRFGYDITLNRKHVLGHFEIDPVRKPNCPGPDFPWSSLMKELSADATVQPTAPKPAPTQVSGSTYTVKAGDTLSEIAVAAKTTVAELKSANGLKSDVIQIGQVLKLSAKAPATTAPKPTTSTSATYTVKSGDTLSEIAESHKTTVAELQKLNNIKNADKLSIGQKLKVPSVAKATPVYHTVKSGDTVSEIAQKYKVTTASIKSLNKLDAKFTIRIGDKLRVK